MIDFRNQIKIRSFDPEEPQTKICIEKKIKKLLPGDDNLVFDQHFTENCY